MKKSIRYGAVVSLAAVLVLLTAGFSCNQAKSAAVAVNRYAESLSHFQDAEITAHDAGSVDDATHRQILEAEKLAAKAGQELDTAIALANQGADYSQWIDNAQKTFDDLLAVVKPTNKQDLVLLAEATGALLKNAISLIQAVHPAQAPAPAQHSGTGLAMILMSLGVFGMAFSVSDALKLLTLITALEPAAVDLVLKLAQSLQGKSTDEVVAMNEALFGKVDTVADQEIAKLDGK